MRMFLRMLVSGHRDINIMLKIFDDFFLVLSDS